MWGMYPWLAVMCILYPLMRAPAKISPPLDDQCSSPTGDSPVERGGSLHDPLLASAAYTPSLGKGSESSSNVRVWSYE